MRLLKLTPDQVDMSVLKSFVDTILESESESEQLSSVFHAPVFANGCLDCSGTGGSGLNTYNTSTSISFILAAGSVPIVKMGNRAISSASGSFDLLEALGFPLDVPITALSEIFSAVGVVFLFAPQIYPAFARLNRIRKSLGVKTMFNYIGPLLNPARPVYRLVGVSDLRMQKLAAEFLLQSGYTKRALVVRGENGLDEMNCNGKTSMIEVSAGSLASKEFNSPYESVASLPKGPLDAKTGAMMLDRLFKGMETNSDYHHMCCLNAGAAFYVAEKVDSIEAGCKLAEELLKSGAVMAKFEQVRRTYGKYAKHPH